MLNFYIIKILNFYLKKLKNMISIDGQGENIKSYEYKGEDHSISYQKIISPLCDKILEYIPIWFSPNILF